MLFEQPRFQKNLEALLTQAVGNASEKPNLTSSMKHIRMKHDFAAPIASRSLLEYLPETSGSLHEPENQQESYRVCGDRVNRWDHCFNYLYRFFSDT